MAALLHYFCLVVEWGSFYNYYKHLTHLLSEKWSIPHIPRVDSGFCQGEYTSRVVTVQFLKCKAQAFQGAWGMPAGNYEKNAL